MANIPFHKDYKIYGGRGDRKMKYGVTLALKVRLFPMAGLFGR